MACALAARTSSADYVNQWKERIPYANRLDRIRYRHSGYSGEEVAARAERTARDNRFRYLYEHSLDEGQFEFVAGELGLSDALEAFCRQAKKQGFRLGSARMQ